MVPSIRQLADGLARALREAGVPRLFGVPGGGANLDVIGAAAEQGIDFVLTHGETAACIAAAAHGRLTGTAGVAVVTRGPGLTSAVNGLAQATLDRAPLLLVSDTVGAGDRERTAHQRLDQTGLAAGVTRWSGTLGSRDPQDVAAAALRLATGSPPGAVHLELDPSREGDRPPVDRPPESDPCALEEARRLVAGARRPVVVVGVDATRDAGTVRAALERLGAPVLVTYQAKGTVPESWPTFAGLFTGAVLERPLLELADLVLGIGLDPVEPMPGPWPYPCPVVLLHSHPVETAYFGSPRVVVGAYGELLPAVLEGAAPEWPPDAGARRRGADLALLDPGSALPGADLTPQAVVSAARESLGDGPLTVDAGAHMLVAMPLWRTDGPDPTLISNGLATMGYALPAAIGAALARPGRRVACLVGDGGLGMVLAELETLARLELDVTVVVFDDAALTLIALKQVAEQGGPAAVRYGATDFAAAARAMGVPAETVDDLAGLRRALGPRGRGPRLVAARIDPSGYREVIRTIRG